MATTLTTLTGAQLEQFRAWCRSLDLKEVTKSGYVKGRKEKWFTHGSNLQSPTKGGAIFAADAAPDFIKEIGDKYYKGWNSILVCGNPTSIKWHRDHGHFEANAVMINLGTAKYEEMTYRHAKIGDGSEIKTTDLKDGQIVMINTKLLHQSTQTSDERFNITFRRIKDEYLKPSAKEVNRLLKEIEPF